MQYNSIAQANIIKNLSFSGPINESETKLPFDIYVFFFRNILLIKKSVSFCNFSGGFLKKIWSKFCPISHIVPLVTKVPLVTRVVYKWKFPLLMAVSKHCIDKSGCVFWRNYLQCNVFILNQNNVGFQTLRCIARNA